MCQYIERMLEELPTDMDGEAVTTAVNHLLQTNPNDVELNEKLAQMYHYKVAKLLFLCKRASPDIQTAVEYLITRVQKPDEDYYKKLIRVMKYIRETIRMKLTLESDDLHILKWWADGSFVVQEDMTHIAYMG